MISHNAVRAKVWKQSKSSSKEDLENMMRAWSLQSCPTLCDPIDYRAFQAPLSVGFSRQEYWRGLPCPPPEDPPDPRIDPESLMSLALASRFFTTSGHLGNPLTTIHLAKRTLHS